MNYWEPLIVLIIGILASGVAGWNLAKVYYNVDEDDNSDFPTLLK